MGVDALADGGVFGGEAEGSKPIGKKTLRPRMRRYRAAVSAGAMAYQWPTWISPEV